jgi:hypothetical protein
MDERSDIEDTDHGTRLEEPPQAPLAFGVAGDFFFHYTTADAAFSHILPSRMIRMTPYPMMRDPTESKDWRFTSESPQMDHVARAIEEALNGIRARLAVDAEGYEDVVSAPFGRGYARARMWEQYADNHAGV